MQIGISTSVFREQSYSLNRTVSLATGHYKPYESFSLPLAQLYLKVGEVMSVHQLQEIAEKIRDREIEIITHVDGLPVFKSDPNLANTAAAHNLLMRYQAQRIAVVHYESGRDEDLTKLIDEFNGRDITVAVEGIHEGVKLPAEQARHDAFLDFIWRYRGHSQVQAVLDWGRYFIARDLVDMLPVEHITGLIAQDYARLRGGNIPVIFHTIGITNRAQEREHFTAPGARQDLIPQTEIWQACMDRDTSFEPMVILEVENISDAIAGVEFFRKL